MKIVIFGLGSIGIRHAKILMSIPNIHLFAFRSKKRKHFNTLGIKEIYSWEEVDAIKADVALIANPTFLHVETAIKCAKLGMHLFIEKPLSHDMTGLSELDSLCQKNNLVCYTAYCLRFHPVIRKAQELIKGKELLHVRVVCSSYLPQWRKNTDSKSSYSASKKQGGGVLLDISHEFDYVQYLFGKIKTMQGIYKKVSDVTNDAEDFADVLIETDESVHINLHLSYLSRINERTIKIDFENGYLIADLIKNQIEFPYKSKKENFKFDVKKDDYLRDQVKYFLDNIANKEIINNLDKSSSLLKKILELKNV